ncbi:hypothetical protein [Nostoc sp. KVJ3]|uniref:hypothetical protein n=1 Tax=Nostoc sp. KVJ3 TaxID=457945 RepID=UPI0022389A49|nr:hypothetical protein [Nostoc sp. KVJ3]
MKLTSFRLRIALLSTALAGTTLIGFGAVSWFQIYNAKISRLDAELLNYLMRATPNLPPRGNLPNFWTKETNRHPIARDGSLTKTHYLMPSEPIQRPLLLY